MEFNLKLSEVLDLNRTIKLIIDDTKTKIDSLFKFRLLGIMKSIESHVNNFEIIRNEKINEYGQPDENGNVCISKDDFDTIRKFNDDMLQIINSEVCINISKLKVNDVFDKGVKADYLIGLYPVIEE